jgi:hypothetical protein
MALEAINILARTLKDNFICPGFRLLTMKVSHICWLEAILICHCVEMVCSKCHSKILRDSFSFCPQFTRYLQVNSAFPFLSSLNWEMQFLMPITLKRMLVSCCFIRLRNVYFLLWEHTHCYCAIFMYKWLCVYT